MFGTSLYRLAVAVAVGMAVSIVSAQAPINIRLATLAPDNSPWTSALRTMGMSWQTSTGGRVRMTVYAGTIASESSAISRMAVDGLQAATLMVPGLAEIDQAFEVFGLPFFFASDAELAHVRQRLTPLIRERLRAKGYHLLNWGSAGWVQMFSKNPIRTLDEVKQARLYTTEGSPKVVQWYTANGFHAVPLPAGEIPKQLKLPSGAITVASIPPAYAVALQIFKDAPYMLDTRIAPLLTATVMTDAAWNRIAPDDRTKMLAAASVMEQQTLAQAPALDARSIAAMTAAGLQVVTQDGNGIADFRRVGESMGTALRGVTIPADVYDLAVRERDAFRARLPR